MLGKHSDFHIRKLKQLLIIFRIGYSKKGWTNHVIGVAYAKDFHEQMKDIAQGRARALYVNSHDSHLTYEFLTYCKSKNIHVPAYPPHGTHVYQLLDVCLFGPLKLEYGRLRDEHYRNTGEAVTKENFLKVYGEAHLNTLKPELIKKAFCKVGIVPVNRNVITPAMIALSKDTSYKVYTPAQASEPVQIVSDLLMDAIQPRIHSEVQGNIPPFPIRTALPQLAATDIGYLVSPSPIKAASQPPDIPDIHILPVKHGSATKNLERKKTPYELELEEQLVVERAWTIKAKGQVMQLEATVCLQWVYVC